MGRDRGTMKNKFGESAWYVAITFLLNLAAFVAVHIFLPEDSISTDMCFKWALIMLGMCAYLVLYHTIMGNNED